MLTPAFFRNMPPPSQGNAVQILIWILILLTQHINKNTKDLVVANNKAGLEVNAVKIKYMVMSRDQNTGLSLNINIDNSSFVKVKEFKYLGTNLTNQNSIPKEIKSRLKSGNACYHQVQNLLSSSLLSKNLEIKIYRTIILPVFCMGLKLGR